MIETFAERFARLLFKERGLSVEEVAATMKAGADAVRRVADGRTKQPRFDEMMRVCDAYGIDPYVLAFGSVRQPTSEVGVDDLAQKVSRLAQTVEVLRQELIANAARQERSVSEVQARLQALEGNEAARTTRGRQAG